jgi:hypothetical protein
MDRINWVAGFATFIGVSLLFYVGFGWVLDYWWTSEGLDPATRPPLNAGGQWMLSGGVGLAAGWIVGKIFGKD